MIREPVQNTRRAEFGLQAISHPAYNVNEFGWRLIVKKWKRKIEAIPLLSSARGSWVLIYISIILYTRTVWKTVEKN